MKKLNRKGFTLIELLAVIVVLAIVMVVTIPSVLKSMNNAKTGQLQNAADSVSEWFQKQYDSSDLSGLGEVSAEYTTFLNNRSLPTTEATAFDATPAVLKAAGLTNTTGLTGKIWVSSSKVCVKLTAGSTSSFYVSVPANTTDDNNPNIVINNACK